MTYAFTRTRAARALRCALAACALMMGLAIEAKGRGSDPEVPGEVLVKLLNTSALGPLLNKYQLSLVSQFGARPIYRLKVVGLADAHDTIAALDLDPNVLIAEPNFVHESPEARKNNGWAIGAASAYTAQWAPGALRLTEAHRVSTGLGMRVAILDTGVDSTHPALAGRLLPGFDFVDGDKDPSEVGNQTTNVAFGHGTHVAGLIAMAAPGAQILPLRVLDANGEGNAWVLAEAMLYAVDPDGDPASDDGVHVMNLSLGSFRRTNLLNTIAQLAACEIPAVAVDPVDDFSDPGYNADKQRCANSLGAAIVAAAGNDASRSVRQYPAAEGAYGLMAVAASNQARQIASFSNFGGWIHVAAPGDGITSTLPAGSGTARECKPAGCFGTWSGTSMAAPLAAGTIALARAAHRGLTAKDVVRRVVRTTANLCGTKLRQVDPLGALADLTPPDTACP